MIDSVPSYTFLPWLRQGLANNISTADIADNLTSVILRASIPVQLTVKATNLDGQEEEHPLDEKKIELFGPGDIIGIDSKVIVKTEPHNWITNFEPNYLPFIEFYDEDFPWRYTPAHPDATKDRLRPWLTLVVLKEDEFEDGANIKDKPLPYFKLKSGKTTADIFPKPSELWAWAHVHVNTDLSNGAAANLAAAGDVKKEIGTIINQYPDQAYSRIICPRKLEDNVGYHAFLIPTFESGRLAGLGLPFPTDAAKIVTLSATKCAWFEAINTEFPYYYRWYFKTGSVGDFEYLVNLLQPKPADKSIGVRNMDVMHVGANPLNISDTNLHGVLKLGGALKVPYNTLKSADKDEVDKYEEWDEHPSYPHKFTSAMAKRINLADEYVDPNKQIHVANNGAGINLHTGAGDPDPVITMPLYGCWHAMQKRLLYEKDNLALQPSPKNWIHELNLDPRYRVSAGLGTKVVQKNQEAYSQAAWEQVGAIVEANNKMRLAQMAKEVSVSLYNKHLLPLKTERAFVFTAAVQSRIIYYNLTVQKQVVQSVVPLAITSGTFRSITRPRGITMRRLFPAGNVNPGNLVERINEGEVIIAPPKTDPEGAINLSDIAEEAKPKNIPGFIEKGLRKHKWFKFLPLLILLLLLLIILLFFRNVTGSVILAVLVTEVIWLYLKFNKWDKEIKQAEAISQDNQTPEAVDGYPLSPNFIISEPGSGFTPSIGNTDSEEAIKFKAALKDVFTLVNMKFPEPEKNKLPLTDITTTIVQSLNPAYTIPKRTLATINIPGYISDNMVEEFSPVWVYPVIDLPMYKPLVDISSELFLPNINLIEQNSITLLENNQKFIEAYMVGLNHEMSRELLWREFPTDQRGSYFRQFWDISGFLPPQPVSEDTREKLRDIPPIDKWPRRDIAKVDPADPHSPLKNELGTHNQRNLTGGKTQLVLIIRGEILKKYPTAVIYAHKADWGPEGTTKNVKAGRILKLLTPDEVKHPPATVVKTALFQAKVEPDIYFLGFDLTGEDAKGTLHPASTNDNSGWFFVIKERPGEPRFGLDLKADRMINWNNFSWKDISTPDGKCIELINAAATPPLPSITSDSFIKIIDPVLDKGKEIREDDKQAGWNADTNSAQLAYILYQEPVLVAVHASRMLPK